MRWQVLLLATAIAGTGIGLRSHPAPPAAPAAGQTAPLAPPGWDLGTDPNGNFLRRALKTGHVSNYDEAKVRPYTLPDVLKLSDGTPVRDAKTWQSRRRPEIIKLYESQIFGRVPTTPKVNWRVTQTDLKAQNGQVVRKQVVGTAGDGPRAVRINLAVYTPAGASKRVPVILLFGGGTATPAAAPTGGSPASAPPPLPRGAPEFLARGWGFATLDKNDIQPDRPNALTEGIIGLTLAQGQTQPAGADGWGTIAAWAWGISRAIDYLSSDPSIDPKRIAVYGHSRLGKTALWASATDQRIAAVFPSCSGEMGAALSRRDWGEAVDDMTQNFPYWFARNFQQWEGHWNDMPVDAHMLIALSAPRPVFVTGGSQDQWADPVGMFLAEVAAGPVYRLLGRKDLGVTELPPLDTPLTAGDLGWRYHTGGHTTSPADWAAFLTFLDKYFK